jgi:hypothetical protein
MLSTFGTYLGRSHQVQAETYVWHPGHISPALYSEILKLRVTVSAVKAVACPGTQIMDLSDVVDNLMLGPSSYTFNQPPYCVCHKESDPLLI